MPIEGPRSLIRAPRTRRLQRGVAQSGLLTRLTIAGIVIIAVGVYISPMDWTRPEVLKALGLDFGMVLTNLGIFLVFVGVLNSFFYAPFKEAIDKRNSGLEETFTEAENLKKEMGELRTSYEARLAQTEADAREQIQAQIREAQSLRQTLMAEAAARSDEMVKKAELEIEAEKQRVLGEIRGYVVDLTLTATEKLIAKNVDSATNRKLVEETIEQMAVSR